MHYFCSKWIAFNWSRNWDTVQQALSTFIRNDCHDTTNSNFNFFFTSFWVCSTVFFNFHCFTDAADNFVNFISNCFRSPFNFFRSIFWLAACACFLFRFNSFVQNTNKVTVVYLNDTAAIVSFDCQKYFVASFFLNNSSDITVYPFYSIERNCLATMVNNFSFQFFS